MKNIDIKKLFTDHLCTFEMAKKAAAAGMTCANTFFAYDEKGDITDGAWLQKVAGKVFYPAINLPMAIVMLEDCELQLLKLICYQFNNKYFLKEGSSLIGQQENLVDLFVAAWIKYKKPEPELLDPSAAGQGPNSVSPDPSQPVN